MPVIGSSAQRGGEPSQLVQVVGVNGFAVARGVVPRPELDRLRAELPPAPRGGRRNLLSACPGARRLADSDPVQTLARAVLGPGASVVRAILFDKTPDANWRVPYHQDGSIAVRERVDLDGFGPWSVKDGVTHVQPPAAILERMITIRLHIDPCDAGNGPLTVLPGSHAHGFLGDAEIAHWKAAAVPVVCAVEAGDAVIMRPLVLHASPKAASPAHRRVVHLEFAVDRLPGGLEWASP